MAEDISPSEDPGRDDQVVPPHRADFQRAQQDLLAAVGLDASPRRIDGATGRIHLLEAGASHPGAPLVFVHGTAAFGAFLAPVMARVSDRRMVTFDRPGYGLSDPFVYAPSSLRNGTVGALERVVEATGADQVVLVGHSMGGNTAIRFALEHPDRVRRLVLLGAAVGFPGTHPPFPIRLLTVPVLGELIQRSQESGEEGVLDVAEIFGEREAIREHPAFIRAVAAHEADPGASRAGLSEFRTLASLRGWRDAVRLQPEDLGRIRAPTVMLWGRNDPLGTPPEGEHGLDSIPDLRIEPVEAGHMPFLAHPRRCARVACGEDGPS